MLWSSIPQPVNPRGVIPAAEYIDFGWHIIPVSGNKIPLVKGWVTRQPGLDEFPAGCRFSQVTGPQLDGSFVIGPEFDHKPEEGIDATANYHAFLERISEGLFLKLHITRSTGGLGFHIRAQVPRPVASSIIRNAAGKKIGDLRAAGGHLVIQQPEKWLHGAPWTMGTLTESELDELLKALNYQAPVEAGTSDLDWSAVSSWSDRIEALLTDGIPSRFRPTCQGAHYLRNSIPVRRTSEIRYALIEELIRCEYNDTETVALALHLADFGATARKGRSWLEKDIERIVTKVRASGPRTRRKPVQAEIPVDSMGIRRHKHEAAYLFWAKTNITAGRVMMDRGERAASYGVSLRTLDRIEAHLISTRHIRRGLSHDRRIAWVEILPEPTTFGTAKPDNTHIDPDPDATGDVSGVGGVGEGGNAAVPEKPLLAHVVEDALEALGESRIRKRRGEVILAYVRCYLPDANADVVAWHAKHAAEWRRQRRSDEAMREKLAVMADRQLKSKQRGLERKSAECHQKGNPAQAWVFGRLVFFIQKELDKPERQERRTRAKAIQQVLRGVE